MYAMATVVIIMKRKKLSGLPSRLETIKKTVEIQIDKIAKLTQA